MASVRKVRTYSRDIAMEDVVVYAHQQDANWWFLDLRCVYHRPRDPRDKVETPEPKIASKWFIDKNVVQTIGELAQMVERSIRIREAPGSMPGFSTGIFYYHDNRLQNRDFW